MEDEELKKISEIESKIQEKIALLSKIANVEENQITPEKTKAIIKDLHVERGRLIKYYKSNKKYIEELYSKYDLYLNVLDILNREENENYTMSDKMNDIKNVAIANNYSPFENKLLGIINDNLGDLNALKSKLLELDSNGGIRKLGSLKECYADQLNKHKDNINSRYSSEFIHKKATIPSLITVLPKAVALAVKKVAVCIDERKEAKTNKEKLNKFGKILSSIGQLIATPVIYAGKFVIDHWYLLLLLLMWFPNLFPFFKGKNKDKNKESQEMEEQHQEQEATEAEAEYSYATNPETSLVGEPVIENNPELVPKKAPVNTPVKKPISRAVALEGEEPVSVRDGSPAVLKKAVSPSVVRDATVHTSEINLPVEQQKEVSNLFYDTLRRFNERSNGQFYVSEIDGVVRDEPLIVCRTPMDYLKELCKWCNVDIGDFVDSNNNITKTGYEFMLERNIGRVCQDTRIDSIIFEDPSGQYLSEFNNALGQDVSDMYDRFTTVRCFDTIEDFSNALASDNTIYNGLRNEFVRELNVSESQDAIECLKAFGFVVGTGGLLELGASSLPAIASSPALIEAFQKLVTFLHSSPSYSYSLDNVLKMTR